MKTSALIKSIGIITIVLTVVFACIKTGGDATALIVVLICSAFFVAASINTKSS